MLDETEVLKLGRDISAALVFARNRGLVHRDVKQQNIFVDEFRNSGSRTYTSEKKQGKNRKTASVIGAFAVVCMLFLVIAAGYKILPYINNSEEKGSYRIISDRIIGIQKTKSREAQM